MREFAPILGPSAVPVHASERRFAESIHQCNASLQGSLGTATPRFDKGNLVLGGPFRGNAVFGPADSERHFRPGRTEIGHA